MKIATITAKELDGMKTAGRGAAVTTCPGTVERENDGTTPQDLFITPQPLKTLKTLESAGKLTGERRRSTRTLKHRPPYISYCMGKKVDVTNNGENPLKVQILEGWKDGETTLYRVDKRSARNLYNRQAVVWIFMSNQHPRLNTGSEIEYGYIPMDFTEPFDDIIESYRISAYCGINSYRTTYWVPSEFLNGVEHNYNFTTKENPFNNSYDDEWLMDVLSPASYEWI